MSSEELHSTDVAADVAASPADVAAADDSVSEEFYSSEDSSDSSDSHSASDEDELSFDTKKEVLRRLLDTDEPFFTNKVREFLIKKDVCEILISFITRVPEGVTPVVNPPEPQESSSVYIDSSDRRSVALYDESDSDPASEDSDGEEYSVEAKRAEKATDVFVYQASTFSQEFINDRFESLVSELFKIFDVTSLGTFDHFDKVFQALFTPHSGKMIEHLSSKGSSLILNLLNYLHDPCVCDSLITLLKSRLPEDQISLFYESFNHNGFFNLLADKLFKPADSCVFRPATEFYMRLVEECSPVQGADQFFRAMMDGPFFSMLVEAVVDESGKLEREQHRSAVASLKSVLLKSGQQLFDNTLESYIPTPLPNMLQPLHDPIHEKLHAYVPQLCAKFVFDTRQLKPRAMHYSAFTIKRPLTMHRLAFVEVLVELASSFPAKVFPHFDDQFWKTLVNDFFTHRFNNVFHNEFMKLFDALVHSDIEFSLRALLKDAKFLSRMIDHYRTTTYHTSGCRGHLLRMCNVLRLQADCSEPSSFVRQYLTSHTLYREFLDQLKEETAKQLFLRFPPPRSGSPFGSDFSMYGMRRVDASPAEEDPENVDVELGSEYADGLGFGGREPYISPTASTPGGGGGSKRRRRRRAKKKKQAKDGDEGVVEEEAQPGEGEENAEEESDGKEEESDGKEDEEGDEEMAEEEDGEEDGKEPDSAEE